MTNPGGALSIEDVLATSYLSAVPPSEATKANSALLLVDIQHLAEPAYLASKAVKAGLPEGAVADALADYDARFKRALSNCVKVLETARAHGVAPVHVKIQSLSSCARDTGALHRRLGWRFPPGDPATEFLPETAPLPGEIVITKTASGSFAGTSLDSTLRNMGVEHLFICGFVADECVETTARAALDLGYVVKIVSDGTTTYRADAAAYTMNKFTGFGFTMSAEDVIELFARMPEA